VPIVRVESSIPLPAATSQPEALEAVAECIVRHLDVKPVQVRVAFVNLDPAAVMVAGKPAGEGPPWIVGWVSILEGRPEDVRAAFVSDLLDVLAKCYRVDGSAVRVLVQTYPAVHWGIGRAAAAAKG